MTTAENSCGIKDMHQKLTTNNQR